MFTGVVQITDCRVKSGFGEHGREGFVLGNMELEGSLTELYFGEWRGRLPADKQSAVNIAIEFNERQEIPDEVAHEDRGYIGTCSLWNF